MESESEKAVSAEKLAANRANAQKSTGPKSTAGKKKSSRNSWKHGLFAKRYFNGKDHEAEDWEDFKKLLDGVCGYYQPVGSIESFWAERIAFEMLRFARLAGHEQGSFKSGQAVLGDLPIEIILRVQAASSRQIEFATKQLEKLQQTRKLLPAIKSTENQIGPQNITSEQVCLKRNDLAGAGESAVGNCETNPNPMVEGDPIAAETQ